MKLQFRVQDPAWEPITVTRELYAPRLPSALLEIFITTIENFDAVIIQKERPVV
jgi:hypothetical protein